MNEIVKSTVVWSENEEALPKRGIMTMITVTKEKSLRYLFNEGA